MSVTEVNEFERDSEITEDGVQLVRRYKVHFSSDHDLKSCSYDSMYASAGGTSIPDYGEIHPQHDARVVSVTPDATESRRIYEVEVRYEEDSDTATDPLDEPPDVEWTMRTYQEAVRQDIDGNPVQNSAGEYFEEPVTRQRHVPQYTLRRNVGTFDANRADKYTDTLNDSLTKLGGINVSATYAKIDEWTAKSKSKRGVGYWEETVKISLNRDNWDDSVMDQGFRALDTSGNLAPIYVKDLSGGGQEYSAGHNGGQRVTDPVKLNGNGQIAQAQLGTTSATFVTIKKFPRTNWSTLNLP